MRAGGVNAWWWGLLAMQNPFTPAASAAGSPDMWAASTYYKQGTQAVSPSDFNVYIRKTNGAGSVDPASDATNWQPMPTGIKSIQRGIITTAIGTSATATISAVNTAKAELRWLGGLRPDGSGTTMNLPTLTLTNSTTVTASWWVSGGMYAGWELTERY